MRLAARGLSEHSNMDGLLMGRLHMWCWAPIGAFTIVAHMQEDERGSIMNRLIY